MSKKQGGKCSRKITDSGIGKRKPRNRRGPIEVKKEEEAKKDN